MQVKPSGNPMLPWQIRFHPTIACIQWCKLTFGDENARWIPVVSGLQFRYFEDALLVVLAWSEID